MGSLERVKTGIKGFDELVEGGFPKGSTILITGSPGTGKTIFGLEFLYNGATKFKEKGLFVTFEERKESLLKQAIQFGWDIAKLEKNKLIHILAIPSNKINQKTINLIKNKIEKEKIQRMVVDSLTTLTINAPIFSNISKISVKQIIDDNTIFSPPIIGDYMIKQFIYTFINQLQEVDVTSLLVSASAQSGEYMTIDTVSEYAADGVIVINFETLGGAYSRTLLVRKMRQTHNEEDIHPLEIGGKGLVVHKIQ
jgi:KaiC/GvpD/RAD55 family RecA-like ATPase